MAQAAWPHLRVRRLADRRTLLKKVPVYEVEMDKPGTLASVQSTDDPVATLTAIGLARIDATGLMREATIGWDGTEGAWVGLPEGRRASPHDMPLIRVRRLADEGRRERYEVQVDNQPVEQHDSDSLWQRVRAGTHPADDSPPVHAWNELYARGDHTTWVDYTTGGLVTDSDDSPAGRLAVLLDGTADLLARHGDQAAAPLAHVAGVCRSATTEGEASDAARQVLVLFRQGAGGINDRAVGDPDSDDQRLLDALRPAILGEAQRLVK